MVMKPALEQFKDQYGMVMTAKDDNGNIGSEDCIELVGKFCFVSGDTINWEYDADQSISTDICDACWMSSAAWGRL